MKKEGEMKCDNPDCAAFGEDDTDYYELEDGYPVVYCKACGKNLT